MTNYVVFSCFFEVQQEGQAEVFWCLLRCLLCPMLNVGCRPWLSQDRRRSSSDYHRQPSHRGSIGQRRCDAPGSRREAGELGDVFWSGGQESDWKEGVCCSWASKMFCLIFVRSFTAQVSIRGVVMSPRLPLSYNHYALKIELIEFTGCCRLYNLCRGRLKCIPA